MTCFHIAIAASILALTAASAPAADFPKKGATKATGYFTGGPVEALEGWEAGSNPEIYVSSGMIRNEKEGGPFDTNYVRCIGQDVTIAGKLLDNGFCTETDKAGDMIFLTYSGEGFTYIGGTGKYKGITGGGTNKGDPTFQDGKNWAAVVSFEKHWEIK